ncbi:MAG TPA: hypothetical protein V6C89_00420 [Drouetiella sp.]|jgi:hypothetical protein
MSTHTREHHKEVNHPAKSHGEHGGDDNSINHMYNEVQQARQKGSSAGTGGGGTYSNSEGVRDALTSANHYVHTHGFPNVFITGTGSKGELLGKDDHGNKVHIRDGAKGSISAKDDSGHEVKGDNSPGDGKGKKVTMPNDQGGGKINDDGSGTYNVNGGRQGAWGATRQVLEDQAHQRGMNDYKASNTDIANAERKMAADAGFHGKNAVNDWAKHLKPGDIHAPAADLRSPAFNQASKGRDEVSVGSGPSREVQKQNTEQTNQKTQHETESGRVNDSRIHEYGGSYITNQLHSWGFHGAAEAFDQRTTFKTDTERDAKGVKSFTTKYGGDGAQIQVRAGSNGQDITFINVTEARGERASNGNYKMTWVANGKEVHGHMAPDGKLVFDE